MVKSARPCFIPAAACSILSGVMCFFRKVITPEYSAIWIRIAK